MKKEIIKRIGSFVTVLIIILGVFVVPEPIEVHGEENAAKEYYIEFLASSDFNKGSNKYQGYSGRMEFTLDKNIAMYCDMGSDTISVNTLILNPDGSFLEIDDFLSNISKNVSGKKNYWYKKGSYEFFGGRSYEYYILTEEKEGYINGRLYWKTATIEESGYLATNIPIFSNIDSAKGFLEGNLDISNAVNFSDLQTQVFNDSDVPTPRNLNVIHDKEKNRYYISWEQTSEDIEKLSVVGFVDTVNNFSSPKYTELVDYKSQVACTLEPALTHKIDVTASVLYFKEEAKKLGYEEYNAELYFTVMNAYFSTRTEMRYAYYVSARLIISRSEDGGFNVKFDVEETDNNFEQVEGSDYNKITIDFEDLDISDRSFFAYISSGFGMLGDNGLIALLSSTYVYLPHEFWIVLISGNVILFFVALFKLVLK